MSKTILNVILAILSIVLVFVLIGMCSSLYDRFHPYRYLASSGSYLMERENYGRLARDYYEDHADILPLTGKDTEYYAAAAYAADSFFLRYYEETGNTEHAGIMEKQRAEALGKMGSLAPEAKKIEAKLNEW